MGADRGSERFLNPVGRPILLEHDPTFVDIQVLHHQPVAIVGTSMATVQMFLCDRTSGLVPVIEQTSEVFLQRVKGEANGSSD